MEKSQRNGVIIMSVICFVVILVFLIPKMLNGFQKDPTVISDLNQPYEHNGLRITATDIKSINVLDSDNQIYIGVKWEFENISNDDRYVNHTEATAYVDDVAVSEELNWISPEENIEMGKLAPGKRTVGYYCVKAPKDAKQIELNYKDDTFSKVNVTFVFDIPPVEE